MNQDHSISPAYLTGLLWMRQCTKCFVNSKALMKHQELLLLFQVGADVLYFCLLPFAADHMPFFPWDTLRASLLCSVCSLPCLSESTTVRHLRLIWGPVPEYWTPTLLGSAHMIGETPWSYFYIFSSCLKPQSQANCNRNKVLLSEFHFLPLVYECRCCGHCRTIVYPAYQGSVSQKTVFLYSSQN